MKRYFIETPHTKEECLRALDEIVEYRPGFLDMLYLGCMSGEHTGWAFVEASDETEARNMLPTYLRDKARIRKVGRFTPEQIKEFHKAA